MFTILFMEQVAFYPTRTNDILNLWFTNDIELIHNVKMTLTLDLETQYCRPNNDGQEEATDMQPIRSPQTLSRMNFHKANKKLTQNWHVCLSTLDIVVKLRRFVLVMQAICIKFVSEKKASLPKNKIPIERKVLMK